MEFSVGMKLMYVPVSRFEEIQEVEVVGLRKRGGAKLSNGWAVDEFGEAEGTGRRPGGHVVEIPTYKLAK